MLINLDFTQIEVVVLSCLSEDENLINLISAGRDIYKFFASIMFSKPESEISKDERNILKAPILGISYGRGAAALAEESGKSKEWCQEFISKFYKMFPKTKLIHDKWIKEVNKTGTLTTWDKIRFGFNKYIWNKKTKKKEKSDAWNAKYWEPEIKNYPVQHTAFVVLSLFLGTFFREKALHKKDKYLLVNTVHDSIMLDCRPEFIDEAITDLQEIIDKLPKLLYNNYQLRISTPIRAEIMIGNSWYDLKKLEKVT